MCRESHTHCESAALTKRRSARCSARGINRYVRQPEGKRTSSGTARTVGRLALMEVRLAVTRKLGSGHVEDNRSCFDHDCDLGYADHAAHKMEGCT